jgi:RHH-type proline utilization regulon transcriptional repressor/proline dehydrogenase/delta 1-pyrroline-5-carboxylate dehydrogenase
MVRQAGEPVIRAAMMQAMRIMGGQFVMGRTIGKRSSAASAR